MNRPPPYTARSDIDTIKLEKPYYSVGSDTIKSLDRYPSADEVFRFLRGTGPELLSLSSCGDPVYMYRKGSECRVLVVGGVDANEPLGVYAALHIIEKLKSEGIEDVCVLPVFDSCGYRRNVWIHSVGDPRAYAIWSYRPAIADSPEYSFEIARDRPEVQALKTILHRERPELLITLHSQPFPASYILVSGDELELRISRKFRELSHRFRIPYMIIENLFSAYPRISDGIYRYSVSSDAISGEEPFSIEGYAMISSIAKNVVIVDVAEWVEDYAWSRDHCPRELAEKVYDDIKKVRARNTKIVKSIIERVRDVLGESNVFLRSFEDNYLNEEKLPRPSEIERFYEYSYYYLYRGLWRELMLLGQLARLGIEASMNGKEKNSKAIVQNISRRIDEVYYVLSTHSKNFRYPSIKVKLELVSSIVLEMIKTSTAHINSNDYRRV